MNRREISSLRVARIYLRVSTEEQDLARQEAMVGQGKSRRMLHRRRLPRKGVGCSRRSAGAATPHLRPPAGRGRHCGEDRPHQPPAVARGRKARCHDPREGRTACRAHRGLRPALRVGDPPSGFQLVPRSPGPRRTGRGWTRPALPSFWYTETCILLDASNCERS